MLQHQALITLKTPAELRTRSTKETKGKEETVDRKKGKLDNKKKKQRRKRKEKKLEMKNRKKKTSDETQVAQPISWMSIGYLNI
ncbi:hypothetical protein DAPPUDRAFT_238931 [Daphnia pulex]|uniref:Uncharacterized protein n=1 Tax=Daphnia pulex TaxID=6669 RepID=E9G7U3_DAPPU|nr:hypothetical protein DAPPUDRAFT_238931 [Daphnia pulex]|eukprot:EFX84599.1 hypothetical protein DAPPUDRAFT_238931 [Daphnia pulex]